MYALTRALQYEMGISALSNNFGPGTMAALAEKYGKVDETTVPSANFCRIIQSALYCKGYDGGDIDGTYNSRVKSAVLKLHQDMGVSTTYPGSSLWPKVIKGLFNMDAYVSVNNGSETIRSIQQWLNGNYVLRSDFYIIPCDGHHSRDVAKSLLFAIQYELGMADGTANGGLRPPRHPVGSEEPRPVHREFRGSGCSSSPRAWCSTAVRSRSAARTAPRWRRPSAPSSRS